MSAATSPIPGTPHCLTCQYALTGLAEPRCPECGRQFDPYDETTFGRCPRIIVRDARTQRVLLWWCVLTPLQFCGAFYAHDTIGEAHSFLLILLVVVGIGAVGLLLLIRTPRLALAMLLLITLLIVPRQLLLGARMVMLQREAERIVVYLEQTRAATGSYPTSLSGYAYSWPSLKRYFQHYAASERDGGYAFSWYVGTPNTSHSYSPKSGWGYYPD